MYVLNGFGVADKITVIKAVRAHMHSDLRVTKAWVESLPWSFDNEQLAAELLRIGCELDNVAIVLVAVGMWEDPKTSTWKMYAEGWEMNDDLSLEENKKATKGSCESTILDNGLSDGQPLYWRYMKGPAPIPQRTEPMTDLETV
jgi:hypothetical protein